MNRPVQIDLRQNLVRRTGPRLRVVRPATAGAVVLRAALPNDVEEMHHLLDTYARRGVLLPRTVAEVYRCFREFLIAEHDGRIAGCAGLRLYTAELGEIVGLAVSEESHGQGIGRLLVESLLRQAKELGLKRVIALTLEPGFFHRLGFVEAKRSEYPEKLKADCNGCAKRATCQEIAVAYEL